MPTLGEFDELRALLAETFSSTEASRWLIHPQPLLDGARPVDVFFERGLEALRPVILRGQAGEVDSQRGHIGPD